MNRRAQAVLYWGIILVVLAGSTIALCRYIYVVYTPVPLPVAQQGTKYIALTFDDGPYGSATKQIATILAKKKVRATFFMTGMNVEKYPDIVQQLFMEGHTIANHTYSHPLLSTLSSDAYKKEVVRTSDSIAAIIGVRPALFRAPYGVLPESMKPYLASQDMAYVGWHIDPRDWDFTKDPSGVVLHSVLSGIKPNRIILLHDGRDARIGYPRTNTIRALPYIIDHLKNRGYSFVTADTIVHHVPYHR